MHSDSLVHVIRNMVDAAPSEVLSHLADNVKESLAETKDFWGTMGAESKLLPFVDIQDERQLRDANALFQKLVTLHIRLTLLGDVYSITGYAHARQAAHLLQSSTLEILEEMGTLHRVCIWENILLKNGLVGRGLGAGAPAEQSAEDVNAMALVGGEVASAAASATPSAEECATAQPAATGSSTPATASKKVEGPKEKNVTALKHLAGQLPNALTPFFQGKLWLRYSLVLCWNLSLNFF